MSTQEECSYEIELIDSRGRSHISRLVERQRVRRLGVFTIISSVPRATDLYEKKCLVVLSGAAVSVTMKMDGVLIWDCRWVDGWWVRRLRGPGAPQP